MISWRTLVFGLSLLLAPGLGVAQESPFGGFKHDSKAPIEITADSLEVRQAESIAIFQGNVVAGQGTLRLTATVMRVAFDPDQENPETGAITNVKADGQVFLTNGAETAQGDAAEYDVTTGLVTMSDNVVLTQGENVLTGQSLRIDLNTGVAQVIGRVKSIFTPPNSSN
ncbi:MAG: LptA/OstA family protein [Pseudomonadota bacterium]